MKCIGDAVIAIDAERAADDHALAHLIRLIGPVNLPPTLAMAMRRFAQFQALRREATDLCQALEDRKMIERAKGILMERSRIDEQHAFRRVHKPASRENRKLAEVGHVIVTAEEAIAPPTRCSQAFRNGPNRL